MMKPNNYTVLLFASLVIGLAVFSCGNREKQFDCNLDLHPVGKEAIVQTLYQLQTAGNLHQTGAYIDLDSDGMGERAFIAELLTWSMAQVESPLGGFKRMASNDDRMVIKDGIYYTVGIPRNYNGKIVFSPDECIDSQGRESEAYYIALWPNAYGKDRVIVLCGKQVRQYVGDLSEAMAAFNQQDREDMRKALVDDIK